MDLSKYIGKGKSKGYGSANSLPEKTCLECRRFLENDGSYLYRQRFCSEKCKERYIDKGMESRP